MLGAYDVVDTARLCSFIGQCEGEMGGVQKWRDTHADILHSYLALSGLSLTQTQSDSHLKPISPSLAIPKSAADHLQAIHQKWRSEK